MNLDLIYIAESSRNAQNASDLNENKTPVENPVDDTNPTTNKGLKIEIKDTGLFDMEEVEERVEKVSEKTKTEKSLTNQGIRF